MTKKATAKKATTTEERIAAALEGVDTKQSDCDAAYHQHFPNEVSLHQFRNEWSKKVAANSSPPTEPPAETITE